MYISIVCLINVFYSKEGGDIHPPLPSSDEDTSDRQRDSQELKGNKLTKSK